jgi:Ku protein
MARTVQNTTVTVGLLTVPVALRKITQKQDVKLDRASAAGNKIKRLEVDSVTGEVIDTEAVQHGKFDGETFHPISAAAIETIEAETKIDAFEIEDFIPLADVPFGRVIDAYYLAPQAKSGGAKPLRLLYESLRKTKKAGVFKLTLTKRQYLAVLYADNGGLIVNLLSFADDFRQASEADEAIATAEVKPAEIAMAVELVNTLADLTEPGVIDSFSDDLVALKQRLVDEALAGRTLTVSGKPAPAVATGPDVLMESLKASVAAAAKKKQTSGRKSKVAV